MAQTALEHLPGAGRCTTGCHGRGSAVQLDRRSQGLADYVRLVYEFPSGVVLALFLVCSGTFADPCCGRAGLLHLRGSSERQASYDY